MVERKIIAGLINSTEYIQQIHHVVDVDFIESTAAKHLARWCLDYFAKYKKAPGQDIEGIYFQRLKEGLSEDIAKEIEQDILPSLQDDVKKEKINLPYLLDLTFEYFEEQDLTKFTEKIQFLLEEGELTTARNEVLNYKPIDTNAGEELDLGKKSALERVSKAFKEISQPLIRYPKQLGHFWNGQLTRGAFVALMSPEKRGKSYWLLDFAIRGTRQGYNVAFFQAGDMTEAQQIKRLCAHLLKRPTLKRHEGKQYQPVADCVYNQMDSCTKEERECSFGPFDNLTEKDIRKGIGKDKLIEAYRENKDYVPCHNCKAYQTKAIGTPWLTRVNAGKVLTESDAVESVDNFFIKNGRFFKMSTHANGTLSVNHISNLIDNWEKVDDFIPDIIIIDYADLLLYEGRMEFRHQQNEIWKAMRGLSQKRHCLVITATQADADSYEQNRLKLKNFSEDKRKYAHVTAMYGLNQDTKDREKGIGLMRINELVVREADFSSSREVTILQNIRLAKPFLGSYY